MATGSSVLAASTATLAPNPNSSSSKSTVSISAFGNPSSSLAGSSLYNNGIGDRVSGFSSCENDDEAKMLRIGLVTPEVISWSPRITLLHNFLSSEECDYLIAIGKPRLQRSRAHDRKTGKGIINDTRTSFGVSLSKEESKNPIVQAIEKRISVFSQVPVENGEPIHVLRYEKNQYFRLHSDYFLDTINFKESGGQRMATMLMYLSDNVEGGETYFPMAGTGKCSCAGKMLKGSSVKPIEGDAVLFWSVGLDGKVDPKSVHTGCEVLSGEKWCATRLMRQNKYTLIPLQLPASGFKTS
ncbi:prolyl 4-hydroxylase 1-like [Papaver somniferum]|uniref:prolyl 4-hydroxylase 1-like n=1 Tax=Papaver somniferum TaxID=3469 RepID=UPI000E704A97|nr:prolyl 4-hydroxylase 1-like [Papaver somniferum]